MKFSKTDTEAAGMLIMLQGFYHPTGHSSSLTTFCIALAKFLSKILNTSHKQNCLDTSLDIVNLSIAKLWQEQLG